MKKPNNHFVHKPMPERLVLFAVAFAFWLLLVWPVSPLDGRLLPGDILAGVLVAAFVALVMKEIIRVNFIRFVNPRSWFWCLVYIFVFTWYAVRGGVDVAWRVLHPAMPIKPGIVRVQSVLKTDTGRTALANSITLTPGTLTMEVTDDGVFYVHWLYVNTLDEEQAAEQILRRFEWYIQRIFE
jgi:multicomponent Na+:H+ antiporter subunit E